MVAEKYGVDETTLRVDWQRRASWPKEIASDLFDPIQRELYLIAIHKTLRQIENELKNTNNPNCKVSLLKTKTDILFKLIQVQQTINYEDNLEKKIQALEHKLEQLSVSDKDNGARPQT